MLLMTWLSPPMMIVSPGYRPTEKFVPIPVVTRREPATTLTGCVPVDVTRHRHECMAATRQRGVVRERFRIRERRGGACVDARDEADADEWIELRPAPQVPGRRRGRSVRA